MSSSRDPVLSTHTSWVCTSHTELREILTTPQEDLLTETDLDPSLSDMCEPVLLERVEESLPCVITLLCRPDSGAAISSLQVVSEARTVEVYTLSGDYCGTSRGEEDPRWQHSNAEDKRLFYRSRLVLESPLPSCEVKLLSLGGRSVVGIRQMVVGLRFSPEAEFRPAPVAGIDLHRVRALMEEMGTNLSPGAQNLMEMVQFQQQNKANVLGGFFPLLMGGGGLACMARVAKVTGDGKHGSDGAPAPTEHQSGTFRSEHSGIPDGVAGAPGGDQSPVSPDLLPMLQSVCGQVTQLRLDALTSPEKTNGEREDHMCCGGLEKVLEKVVEKRMHDLEKKLKEHMDTRLDAIQQRLELTLHQLALGSSLNPQ